MNSFLPPIKKNLIILLIILLFLSSSCPFNIRRYAFFVNQDQRFRLLKYFGSTRQSKSYLRNKQLKATKKGREDGGGRLDPLQENKSEFIIEETRGHW